MSNEYRSRQERRQVSGGGNNQPKKKKRFPLFKAIISFLIIMFLIGTATVGVIMAKSPKLDPEKLKTPLSSQIYDKDGKKVSSLFSEENRVKAGIADIPPNVRDAFVSVEDVRFYKHPGVDVRRIFGAAFANLTGGFGSEGGSTITQQVVKNTILTNQKSLTRKIQEAYLAIKLEQKYSKEQILEMYLNKIYFGHGAYGIGTAAKTYFDADKLDQLKLHQVALLAGLPKAPSNYDPLTHPKEAEQRRNVVLGQMQKYGFITKAEADKAKATPVTDGLRKGKLQETRVHEAYLQQVIKDLHKIKGMEDVDVFADGLKIYTNMDTKAQETTEDVLQNASFLRNENKKLQSGIAIVDTKTGGIRAIGSGRDENLMSAYYASGNPRQPGSTIKPILDYGPAIDNMKWDTGHILKDTPVTINGATINNFNNEQFGEVTMRKALEKSENTPAVRTFLEVGESKAVDFANKLGIKIDSAPPAYAIGGFQKGITPLNLAGAYAAFGNEGVYTEPTTIRKIEFPNGQVVKPETKPVAAMKDYTAYMITDMLKGVMRSGTGIMANVPGLNIAGKTGTTNLPKEIREQYGIPKSATNDAWMAGYTTSYSAAVWTGYNKYKDEDGVHYLDTNQKNYSKLIFKEVMSRLNHSNTDFKKPNSVVDVTLEKGTHKKASEFTPDDQKTTELFVRGTEPSEVSNKYEKPASIEGLTAKYDDKSKSIDVKWNYKGGKGKTVYKVAASVDGAAAAEQTISDKKFTVPNAEPGKTYTFQIAAVETDTGKESDPAQTSVTVPGEQQPPAEGQTPDQGNNPGQGNNPDQGKKPGQGQEGSNPGTNPGDNTNPGQGNNGGNNGQPDQGGGQQGGGTEPQNPPGQGQQDQQQRKQEKKQQQEQGGFPSLPDLNQ
ncbi:PBP1A family penicillin-binding protein [Fictibacillus sp. WQ 8-8]|uniref:transglycosylase domain-containing protein n=1 Tax=Fictibacillus sp. WQ 8-8 TaxID=2938788 RepID=UPI00210ACEA6|nr:PBP1A family penicillin-binding protein [Fictibacillus sp. WQ 8-8]MCQ6265990.1 PBP1A family penicillin-binding protein [Fictibacillus sp. WQ 8-8]